MDVIRSIMAFFSRKPTGIRDWMINLSLGLLITLVVDLAVIVIGLLTDLW